MNDCDKSKYLTGDRDIGRIQHLEALESLLEKAGVDREDIVIYGSSILSVHGIKENNDLEFIPHPSVRPKFKELVREIEEAHINEAGQMFFPGEVHTSWPNRFVKYGWPDEKIFSNEECHIEHSGYKFLKAEIYLSDKAALRRPKDLEHLELVDSEGHIGGEGWNWDLFHHLPPWERPETQDYNPSLIEIGTNSLQKYGVKYTLVKGPGYLASKGFNAIKDYAPENLNQIIKKSDLGASIRRSKRLFLPDLLNKQFNEEGEFERYDLIAALLSLEGDQRFKNYEKPEEKIRVNSDGKIFGGIGTLARKLSEKYTDPEFKVSARVSRDEIESKTESWIEEEFNSDQVEKLKERKEELLENSGVYFYGMLWPSVEEHHDEIEAWIRERIDVVETIDLRLGDNIHEFLEEVYSVDERPERWEKERKIIKIQSFGSNIRVLKIRTDDPEFRDWNGPMLSDRIHGLKQSCRKNFQDKLENYEYGVISHFTDNYKHNAHNSELISKYTQ